MYNLVVICAILALTGATKPHILQIVADDLGYNDLGFFNDNKTYTPYINDLIGNHGLLLKDYRTFHLCAPTRASLMTGRFPFRAGFYNMDDDTYHCAAQYTMVPEMLKKQGYDTHAIGKWDVGYILKNCTPTYKGFDSFLGYYTPCTRDYWYHGAPGSGKCNGTDFSNSTGLKIDGATMQGPNSVNGTYDRNVFSDRAIDVIRAHDQSNPLYMYLAFHNVHDACAANRKLAGLHAPKETVDLYPKVELDTWKVQSAMTTELDYGVGNVTEALKAAGMYDNTLIVFISDNGGPLDHSSNYPWRGGKGTVWEGGFRVIGFVSGGYLPESSRGQSFEGMVHSADWFATFQHVASDGERSETEPSAMDSLDMWPAFSTRGTSPRTTAIHMVSNHFAKNHNTIIRHMNFKLINGAVRPATIVGWPKLGSEDIPFGQSRGTLEPGTDHCRAPLLDGVDSTAAGQVCDPVCLFDLSVDPTESNNLANNTKYASVVEQLQKLLAEAAASGPPASYIDLGSKTVTEIMCNQSKEYGFLEPINWK